MSLTSLFNKILHPNKKNEEKDVKTSSTKDIQKIKMENKPDTRKSQVPETLSKVSNRKESNLQQEVEETRDEIKVETRSKMRNHTPSIIVRELPKQEKDDMEDLMDLLTPAPERDKEGK